MSPTSSRHETGSRVTFTVTMRGPTSLPLSLFLGPVLENELPTAVDKLVRLAGPTRTADASNLMTPRHACERAGLSRCR